MFDALYVGATGMRGHQLQIDAIAHNLANLNTVGFRRGVASFAEVSAALSVAAVSEPEAAPIGASARGAGVAGTITLSSAAGELKETGESLHVAIDGPGFIEVIRADGTPAYTRAGTLRINEDRLLTSADGSPLAAQIEIPPDATEIVIRADGRVTVKVSQGEAEQDLEVGQIELVAFPNAAGLQAAGANLYVAPPATGAPQIGVPGESGMGVLRQGFVESSNVQLTDELVTLMLAQRAFELNARVVQAADQMLSITNSLLR
jgi:flagellar basal-body rod protein FlgG